MAIYVEFNSILIVGTLQSIITYVPVDKETCVTYVPERFSL